METSANKVVMVVDMTETWTNGWGKEGTTCRVIYLRVVVVRRKRRKTNIHVCTLPLSKFSISFKTANGELDFLLSKKMMKFVVIVK